MSYGSQFLQDMPSDITPEDRERLTFAGTAALSLPSKVVLYEEMIDRYSDSRPFLLVRLADVLSTLQAGSLAVDLYRKAQSILSKMGIVDETLNTFVTNYAHQIDEKVNGALVKSRKDSYYQKWKPTKQLPFPTNLPHAPLGAQEIRNKWEALISSGSAFFAAYLRKLAIETNHLESVFLLTEESSQDLVRRGICEGTVHHRRESAFQDPEKIKGILNDTLAAYALLDALVKHPQHLNKNVICDIHARLMKTCRFNNPTHYIPAGKTRTETRKTVILVGTAKIECCPFPDVDAEVEYICRMAKQWIKTWRNPFAAASWFHLILATCHPFDDGNGRLVRLLASIPLVQHGYPPISVSLALREGYYIGLRKAYQGDYSVLSQCMLQGMQETIDSVQSL